VEVGEAFGEDSGSGEGELSGDAVPIGEGEVVAAGSGSKAAPGEGELCGRGAPVGEGEAVIVDSGREAAAGEGEGVVFERISSRRFKICSRFQSGTR
jgi:hypothetical protein